MVSGFIILLKVVPWREGGSGWGTHVNPWLIHVNVWQKPLQYCKVISLQLIKINGKKINKGCALPPSLVSFRLHFTRGYLKTFFIY